MNKDVIYYLLLVMGFFLSCTDKEMRTTDSEQLKFKLISNEHSTINFINKLTESDSLNYFNYGYMYMGGGVSAGDINNDGLVDLFFTGNMIANKLYLNKGNLKFEDITMQAGIAGNRPWTTGCTMVDVNGDGWLDIYVNASGKDNYDKRNELFINNGNLTFTEKAEEYGIADTGNSVQAYFFDYDRDNDLDLYIANYPITSFTSPNEYYKGRLESPNLELSDKLYKNENGKFKNVTISSGILNFGLTLSVAIGDMNNDGWPDLYVSNDFESPDFMYINNKNGTFREVLKEATRHTSMYGMGTDIADFNNDGLLDIVQVDMTPEDNRRSKANMAPMDISKFNEMVDYGFHYQYMQNSLQMSLGIDENDVPVFGDVSRMTGIATTDWSWSPLFLDFDNDGYKDLFITNGTRRDINNKDFFKEIDDRLLANENAAIEVNSEFASIPSEKIVNYAFRNMGNQQFQNVSETSGLGFKGFSNGAAYADLDNDGDLELIVNNIDDVSQIYENKSNKNNQNNYLKMVFKGPKGNPTGLGVKVVLNGDQFTQVSEQYLTRGFQSSVAPGLHFGLGKNSIVKNATIIWPDGLKQEIKNIKANQSLLIDYAKGAIIEKTPLIDNKQLFKDITNQSAPEFVHLENAFDDFRKEVLLPHRMSRFGPGLAVADVDGDGMEDFFIGNASGSKGALYLQQENGKFEERLGPWIEDALQEDLDVLFFDADNDGDQDLYVVSGGSERKENDLFYQDRLYINKGNGQFFKSNTSLPPITTSGSKVKAADFDQDGDLDLFVGGRLIPGKYPMPATSSILRNEGLVNGIPKFTDVTMELAPSLKDVGMVTDVLWTDFNHDGKIDLMLTGEWMPLMFFVNSGNGFYDITKNCGLNDQHGWWFSLAEGDFDQDGDTDYVAGNLGLNYKYKASLEEPFQVYANDFDANGQLDIVLGYYQNGKEFPVRGRQCSSEQIPAIKKKFKDYNSFANSTLVDIYAKSKLENSTKYSATNFASSYIENRGDGSFEISPLPDLAQTSSINSIVVKDFDFDGNLDMVAVGNLYTSEVETPRNDAGIGIFIKGSGDGNFKAVPSYESGLMVKGDVKRVCLINHGTGKSLIAALNNEKLKIITLTNSE